MDERCWSDKEGVRHAGGDERRIMWSRSESRPLLWSAHHVNWNSIVGTRGRSGSHSPPLIQFGSSEGVRLTPPIFVSFSSSLPFLSPHGHKSHSNPFAPDVLPPLSPGGLLCTSFRAILLRDGAGRHGTSSRLSPRTWKHIQIYFQGPAWKIFDHDFLIQTNESAGLQRRAYLSSTRCFRRDADGPLIKTTVYGAAVN